MGRESRENRHRGQYVLDRGAWIATCRLCGFRVEDADRRQVASQFRTHIREANAAAANPVMADPVVANPVETPPDRPASIGA